MENIFFMTNNNYNDSPNLIQLEESVDCNAKSIDFLNNTENFEQILDNLFNDYNYSILNTDTCNNYSMLEDEEINLNNKLNNNLMLGKKRSVFNFKYKYLTRKLSDLLCLAKKWLKKLNDPVKIKELENKIEYLKTLRKGINNNSNNYEIDDTNKKFKSEKKAVSTIFEDKRKTKGGESYKTNYRTHTKKNALISKNNSQNVSNRNDEFQKIYNTIKNNSIYKSLHSLFKNLNNLFNFFKKELKFQNKFINIEPKGNNDIEELNITFYYNKLLTTFQVSKGFKEFFHKIKGKDFLKHLYNKYKVILEDKNLIKKILEDANSNQTIPPKYYDTEIKKNIFNLKMSLSHYGMKAKNTPSKIKIMLKFMSFMYNIFCLLGYVNEEGAITNNEAKIDIETLMNKIKYTINLYKINSHNKLFKTKIRKNKK